MKDISMSNFHMVLCLGACLVSAVIVAMWIASWIKAKRKEAIRVNNLRYINLRTDDLHGEVNFLRAKITDYVSVNEKLNKELKDKDFAIANLTGRLKEANEKLKEQTIDNRATALRWAVEFCKVSGMDVVAVAKAYYRFIQGKA